MVAFDNTILSLLLYPDAELQEGPSVAKGHDVFSIAIRLASLHARA
jgi:hypothetical protein